MLGRNDGETVGGSELRALALMVLAAVAVVVPLQACYAPAPIIRATLIAQGLHAVLAGLLIIASFTGLGGRHADRLGLLFVLGLATNICAYLYLLPAVVPIDSVYPALAADGITFVLIGATVFLAWSVRRTIVVSAVTWLALGLVGAILSSNGVLAAPYSLALGSLGIGMGFAVATARMLGRFRTALGRRHARLRALSVRLMSVQEEERRRLSRELHDGLSQSLTAVSSYLWLIEKQLPEDRETLRRQTAEARRLLAQTLGEMRDLSQRLCPPLLALYGLLASLEAHLKAFEERHRIVTRLDAAGFPARLPVNIETALYRITQEALTNVARHACAHHVRVALAVREGEIRLDIEDDGIGLPSHDGAAPTGTGLTGIAERVGALDGTLAISSVRGTHLHIRIPAAATDEIPDVTDPDASEVTGSTFRTFGPVSQQEHAPKLDA